MMADKLTPAQPGAALHPEDETGTESVTKTTAVTTTTPVPSPYWGPFDRSKPFWLTAGLVVAIILADMYSNVVLKWAPTSLDQMASAAFTAYVVQKSAQWGVNGGK